MKYSMNTIAGPTLRVAGIAGLSLQDAWAKIAAHYESTGAQSCEPCVMDETGREVWPNVDVPDVGVVYLGRGPRERDFQGPGTLQLGLRCARGSQTPEDMRRLAYLADCQSHSRRYGGV